MNYVRVGDLSHPVEVELPIARVEDPETKSWVGAVLPLGADVEVLLDDDCRPHATDAPAAKSSCWSACCCAGHISRLQATDGRMIFATDEDEWRLRLIAADYVWGGLVGLAASIELLKAFAPHLPGTDMEILRACAAPLEHCALTWRDDGHEVIGKVISRSRSATQHTRFGFVVDKECGPRLVHFLDDDWVAAPIAGWQGGKYASDRNREDTAHVLDTVVDIALLREAAKLQDSVGLIAGAWLWAQASTNEHLAQLRHRLTRAAVHSVANRLPGLGEALVK